MADGGGMGYIGMFASPHPDRASPSMPQITPRIALLLVGFQLGLVGSVLAAWTWAIGRKLSGGRVLAASKGEPAIVPWGAASVVVCGLMFLASQVAGLLVVMGIEWRRFLVPAILRGPLPTTSGDEMLAVTLGNLGLLPALAMLLGATSGASPRDLGLSGRPVLPNVARGMVAYLLLAPLVMGLMIGSSRIWPPTAHPLQKMILLGGSWRIGLLAVLSAVVMAPLAEEILFRGILLGWLWRVGVKASPTGWHLVLPNVITSLIFAGIHAPQWPAPIPLFVLSMGLGTLYRRTGSLWGPIALHACQNGVSTAMLLILVNGAPGALPKNNAVGLARASQAGDDRLASSSPNRGESRRPASSRGPISPMAGGLGLRGMGSPALRGAGAARGAGRVAVPVASRPGVGRLEDEPTAVGVCDRP